MDESGKKWLVILTGAGVSAESGIPTFRDPGGLWDRYDPEVVCTASGLYENPELVLDFLNVLRRMIGGARPNDAHEAIAGLEREFNVTVITQNIDDLHERAGSTDVIHIHGEAAKVTSSARRLDPQCLKDYPLDRPVRVGDRAADGSQLRPAVLFMDEYPYDTSLAEYACRNADLFLVIGTSLRIGVAPSLISMVRKDVPRYVIDPGEIDLPGFIHIRRPASAGMEEFREEILRGSGLAP